MTKLEIVNMLKDKNKQLLNQYVKDGDSVNIQKHTVILRILSQKNAINKIDGMIAINIINDIIQDKDKALRIYKEYMLAD